MPVTLNIIETTTSLGIEIVEVVVASASTPGPAGPGVPTGGTDGQVLTKTSGSDYDTAWEDPTGGGGGAPTDATYLVATANGTLSAEVVVGATPGGELGGTWASPTVDASHSGSTHAAVQAAAEATAAAALSSHEGDTTNIHGIADTTALALTANHPSNATFNDHSARHENGGADELSLAGLDGIPAELQSHLDDTADAHDASAISIADAGNDFTATDVEGALAELQADHEADATSLSDHIADTSAAHAASAISVSSTTLSGTGTDVQAVFEELDNLLDDHSARHENGGADEINIGGLDGTPTELTNHLNDSSDAHDASAISLADVGGNTTETDVEGAIDELYGLVGGGGPVELSYVENTSAVNIASTTEGTPTTIVTAGDLAVDGSTTVIVEFMCRGLQSPSTVGGVAVLNLHVSTNGGSSFTDLGRISLIQTNSGGLMVVPVYTSTRLTPAAGTAQYRIVAWASSTTGTPAVLSGAGGAATGRPMSIRVSTVAT